MSRQVLVLYNDDMRRKALGWIVKAPKETRIEFKGPKRSTDQNARLWAMLTDVAEQLPWHGLTLTPHDWKLIFLDALKRETRIVPNLDGTGFVQLSGRSSSDLSKEEFADLFAVIEAFGANHGVKFYDPVERG
jgi:hypothetical protein